MIRNPSRSLTVIFDNFGGTISVYILQRTDRNPQLSDAPATNIPSGPHDYFGRSLCTPQETMRLYVDDIQACTVICTYLPISKCQGSSSCNHSWTQQNECRRTEDYTYITSVHPSQRPTPSTPPRIHVSPTRLNPNPRRLWMRSRNGWKGDDGHRFQPSSRESNLLLLVHIIICMNGHRRNTWCACSLHRLDLVCRNVTKLAGVHRISRT